MEGVIVPAVAPDKAKEAVCRAGIQLQEEKLVARTWGNLSIRVDDGRFAVSPSGLFYEDIEPGHVPLVAISDLKSEGGVKPSSEKALHAAVYRAFPDIGAIVHTHQSAASAVAAARLGIGDEIPCAAYALPTTNKLAESAVQAMKQTPVHRKGWRRILLANHGAVCAARNMADAVSAALDLECQAEAFVAKIYARRIHSKQLRLSDIMALAYLYAILEMKRTKSGTEQPESVFSRFDSVWMPEFIRNVFDRRKDVTCIILSRLPYTRAFAFANMPLKPHLDDMAQIVGASAGCIEDMAATYRKEPGSRNAVFVKGDGALCLGRDASDAGAVQMVLEKASRSHIESAVLGGGYVIPWVERLVMRLIYKKKYSRIGRKG